MFILLPSYGFNLSRNIPWKGIKFISNFYDHFHNATREDGGIKKTLHTVWLKRCRNYHNLNWDRTDIRLMWPSLWQSRDSGAVFGSQIRSETCGKCDENKDQELRNENKWRRCSLNNSAVFVMMGDFCSLLLALGKAEDDFQTYFALRNSTARNVTSQLQF